jgi:signal transduction histidine kinase
MATGSAPQQLSTPSFAPPSLRSDGTCNHDVQFYADDSFLLDSLVRFVGESLELGGAAIVVATKAHRDGLSQRLEAGGVPMAATIQQGRYIALDATQTLAAFMKEGMPDKVLFTRVVGDIVTWAADHVNQARVAIFGEMVALLWQQGNADAAIRLEQFWNDLAKTHSFSLLCGYPLTGFNREHHRDSFARICSQHHAVIPAENYTAIADGNERLRMIAYLQQAELALNSEAAERVRATAQTEEIQTQNQELIEEVRKRENAEAELRRFTRRLLTARDEEQRRIASELHENIAQLLAALSMYFSVLHEEKESLSPRASAVVDNSRDVAQRLLKEVRKLSYLLHPPTLDDMGVGPALREYVAEFVEYSRTRVKLEVSESLGRFAHNVELAIFRIAEEALANANHSTSTEVTVRVSRSAIEVLVEIQDPGAGILGDKSARANGRGAIGMVERARELGGTVAIRSDGQGTVISLTLPVVSLTVVPKVRETGCSIKTTFA